MDISIALQYLANRSFKGVYLITKMVQPIVTAVTFPSPTEELN